MGLTAAVHRRAARRPTVLLAPLPGATRQRLAVETELRHRGWPATPTPADADLLVVCGDPGDPAPGWLDALARTMAAPAARVTVTEPGHAAGALEEGRRRVAGWRGGGGPGGESGRGEGAGGGEPGPADGSGRAGQGGHSEPPAHRHRPGPSDPAGHAGHSHHSGHPDQPRHSHPPDHSDQLGHADHADHPAAHAGGRDHHPPTRVAGLPVPARAPDRDGLRLDRLHLALGPALPDWPPGLVLRLALQGDVVQAVEVAPGGPGAVPPVAPFWAEPWLRVAGGAVVTRDEAARRRCGAHLDSLARLLATAGWPDPAARCRRLRDAALAGADGPRFTAELRAVVRRVRRSGPLRRLLVGLGPLDAAHARALGVTGPALRAAGDVHDRLRVWLDDVERALDAFGDPTPLPADPEPALAAPRGDLDGPRPPSAALLDAVPALLTGAELAGARLILASLDPDLDELVPRARR